MGKIKYFCCGILFLLCANLTYAKQVAFQIVQHDGREDAISEQSYVVEDVLLNSFFEYGYIVTNSDAAISISKEQDSSLLALGIQEALEGSSDYFVQVCLYYEMIGSAQLVTLKSIQWSITSIKTGDVISNKKYNIEKIFLTDEELQKLTNEVGVEIQKSIRA